MKNNRLLRIPPPVIVLLMAGLMWVMNRYSPVFVWRATELFYAGPVLALLGVVILAVSFLTFGKAKTTIDPVDPARASALVTNGIFSWSRNPMYIGFLLILSGWFVWLGSITPAIAIVFYLVYTAKFQISREEAALIEKFGDSYLRYKSSVPRWIL